MISIHESNEAALCKAGWLYPFGTDDSAWIKGQDEPAPKTLEELQWAINLYTWSCSKFVGGVRNSDNFEYAHYIGLDFDKDRTLEWALEHFKSFACIIGTTKSHQKLKNEIVCDRFRVLLRLAEPIRDPEIYKATAKYLIQRYGSDPACSDPARIFFACETIEYVGDEDGDTVMPAPKPKPYVRPQSSYIQRVSGRLPRAIQKYKEGAGFDKGYRNNAIYQAARDYCKMLHYSLEQTLDEMRPFTDESDSRFRDTVRSAFKDGRS